jgi:hypothetical protein
MGYWLSESIDPEGERKRMKEGYDKESVYDEKIAPLLKQVIKVCKDEEIPFVMDFYLKSPDMTPEGHNDLQCISFSKPKDNTPPHFHDLVERMYNRGERPYVMAVTVQHG